MDLDLRSLKGLSLFDLLNLFLLIDLTLSVRGKVRVLLTGMNPGDEAPLDIDRYYEIRRGEDRDEKDSSIYRKSDAIYRFLAYLHHFGLFSALNAPRRAGVVVFAGLSEELLSRLYMYSGIGLEGSRVLPLCPIYGDPEIDQFRTQGSILSWLSGLPKEIIRIPLFRDGEFARVLGFQLSKNVLEHAGWDWKGEYGALGAIAMRILPPDFSRPWVRSSVPVEAGRVFSFAKELGVLELCVGDRGIGIADSLGKTYSVTAAKYGLSQPASQADIIAFAFDKLGTSKPFAERWGGAHALHRILRLTEKYGGYLVIRTSGYECHYDGQILKSRAQHTQAGIGIHPTSKPREQLHPYGVQIQLLLPICPVIPRPKPRVRALVTRAGGSTQLPRIESASAYFYGGEADLRINSAKRLRLQKLADLLMHEPPTRKIAYSFEGRLWTDDEVIYFLQSQMAVLHTHCCFAVGLDDSTALTVKERESVTDELPADREIDDFFHALSAKRRPFAVFTRSQQIIWLGLGPYPFSAGFTALVEGSKPIPFHELCAIQHFDENCEEANVFTLYLDHNPDLFNLAPESGKQDEYVPEGWHALFSMRDMLRAASSDISSRLQELLVNHGCIGTEGSYKLPARREFVDTFIETTPLLQDEEARRQIGAWLAVPLAQLLSENEKETVLVTATAAASLVARALIEACPDLVLYNVDIGHAFSMDKDNLLRNTEWKMPVIIVTDIVDTSHTVAKIESLLQARGLMVRGVISLIRFVDELRGSYPKQTCSWDPPPNETRTARFFLVEMGRPKPVPEETVNKKGPTEMFIVEPFSLHPFSYEELRALGRRGSAIIPDDDELTVNRIKQMEDIGSLRIGHWVYGDHHFRATVSLATLFSADSTGSSICDAICKLCLEHKPTHILAPLHSHICDLLPRVRSFLQVIYKTTIPEILCISTQMLAKRPFYILPNSIKKLIMQRGGGEFETGVLRLLIVDDAIATGRTLETILRAVILRCRRAIAQKRLKFCPVEAVHAFAVLDRQPLSRSTFWSSVKSISVGEYKIDKNRSEALSFSFSFTKWLDVDMPVDDADSCPECAERQEHLRLIETCDLPPDHGALYAIKERARDLAPLSTEAPVFLRRGKTPLRRSIRIGRFNSVSTLELAVWEFYNLLYRGFPYSELIKFYSSLKDFSGAEPDSQGNDAFERLCCEIVRTLMRDLDAVASQGAEIEFQQVITQHLSSSSRSSRVVMDEAGAALGRCVPETDERIRDVLQTIFERALELLSGHSEATDEDGSIRLNLAFGAMSYCMQFRYHSKAAAAKRDIDAVALPMRLRMAIDNAVKTARGFGAVLLSQVDHAARSAASRDSFLPALIAVLEHTVRSDRHSHSHLLPALLKNVAQGASGSPSERIALDAILADFSHCLYTISERLPEFLPASDVSICRERIGRLRRTLSGPRGNDPAREALRRHAADLRNIFPNQYGSQLFAALKSCVTQLEETINNIVEAAACVGITTKVSVRDGLSLNSIYVVAPDRISFEGVFKNFVEAGKVTVVERPRLLFLVKAGAYGEDVPRISVYVISNFRQQRVAGKMLLATGPQMVALGGQKYALFGVSADVLPTEDNIFPNEDIEVRDFLGRPSSCICISCCVAFLPSGREVP